MATDSIGLEHEVVEPDVLERSLERFREARIALPTFAQLANPSLIPARVIEALQAVGPDEPHPLNLFRVNWHNGADRRRLVDVPEHPIHQRLAPFDARDEAGSELGPLAGLLDHLVVDKAVPEPLRDRPRDGVTSGARRV